MSRRGALVALAALTPAGAASQAVAPDLWLVADGDAVVIQLPRVPDSYWGFHLYRAEGAGGEWVRLTQEPVEPVRDPGLALAILGDEAPLLQEITRSASPVETVRRIRIEPATASVFSYLFPAAAEVLGRRYRDDSVTEGGAYRYRAVFVDALGEETEASVEAQVTVTDVTPGPVGSVAAEPGNGRTTVTWRYPAYRGDPTDFVVGYHVYRATDPAGPYSRLTDAPVARNDLEDPAFTDREVENGVRYLYRVRAVDLLRREGPVSGAAESVPADPSPPAAPADLTVLPGDGVAQLAWRISPEPDLAGYWVERSLGLDQPYARMNQALVQPESPVWTDSTAVGGTRYFYRVVAQDEAGRESRPGNPVPVIPFDRTPPPAPGAVSAGVEDRRILLSWISSTGSDVTGYHVYRGPAPETLVRITDRPVTDTAFVDMGFGDQGLMPGDDLIIRVTAVDGAFNESAPSEIRVSVPDDVAPAPPASIVLDSPFGRAVRVAWSASPDLDVERYVVARAAGDGEFLPVDSVDAAAPLVLRDAAVEPGVTYRYGVVAVDGAGNRGEPATDSLTYRDSSPPAGPNFVQAAVVSGGVRVVWERVSAPDLAGYRVYRSPLPTGSFTPVSGILPGDGPLEFLDPDGSLGNHYRVMAVDTSGNESAPLRTARAAGSGTGGAP